MSITHSTSPLPPLSFALTALPASLSLLFPFLTVAINPFTLPISCLPSWICNLQSLISDLTGLLPPLIARINVRIVLITRLTACWRASLP